MLLLVWENRERCVGNDYILDLRIGYSLANAMKSDDVMDTLNYAEDI